MRIRLDWHRFFAHWQKDLKLWLVLMVLFSLIRMTLCILFSSQLGAGAQSSDLIGCFLGGMKFDSRFALIAVAPTFILALFSFIESLNKIIDKIRLYFGWLCITVTIFLGIIDVGFFYEYHDQFNQWIFGVFYDDLRSLFWTVWHAYPVLWIISTTIVISIIIFHLLTKYINNPFFNTRKIDSIRFNWTIKLLCTLFTLFLVKYAITCTLGWHSLSRKDTAITADPFLNKLVYNPYYALYSTTRDFRKRNSIGGLDRFIANGNIHDALKKLFPERSLQLQKETKIEDWLQRTVEIPKSSVKPDHIFLVIMESQDSWPMLEAYADLKLAPNLNRLANNGIYVQSFLSAGSSTMPALNSIIMGVPDVGIETQYQPIARVPTSTAIAKQFKDLGYEINLFYAGYLSWRKLGELALNQGFDNVYGCTAIDRSQCNEWGANDRSFYQYVFKKVSSSNKPTFNLLMTASNHPPYSINLKKEGWKLTEVPESLKNVYDGTTSLNVLGHFWYADKCLGEFINQVEQDFSKCLFVITGDHWSRRFLNDKPSLYERKSVPLIFYGPQVLQGVDYPKSIAGCHLDIAPTLIDLIAPSGFNYCTMGSSILDKSRRQIGFGANAVITPETLIEMQEGNSLAIDKELVDLFNAFHAVGWWRIVKGSELK